MDAHKQMARMVDSVQPHCDEPMSAAMTCSHAGSMSSLVMSKLLGGAGAGGQTSNLPNPVFIAVGDKIIYAFAYQPRGWNFRIGKEAAQWQKDEVKVITEQASMVCYFSLNTSSGESYPFEVPTMMGGKELVQMFLDALTS